MPATVTASDWTSIGPAGVTVRDFAVSPAYATDHEIVVLDSEQPTGVYITHDGGITWTTYSLAGQYGIFDDIAYGSNPDVIHLSGVNGAKFMSSYDGGSTWVQHSTGEAHDLCVKGDVVALSGNDFVGISRDGGMTTTIIRHNSTNGLPSSSSLSIEISPNFEQDGLILIGTNTHEVYRSNDGGTTWSWSGTGLPLTDNAAPRNYVNDLLMSPNFGADGTVYAHVWSSGIYKSTDRGNSWSVVVPASPGYAYFLPGEMTCSPAFATDGTLFFTDGSHVRMSQDRGNTWVSLEGGQILGTGEYWSGISPSQNFATDRQFFVGNSKNGLFSGSIPPVPDTTPPVLTSPGDGTTVPAGAIAIGATDNSGSVTLSYTVTRDGQPVTSGSSETGSITIPATTFSTPGTYTVRVTATDGTNPVTSTFTIIVPVPDIPVPEFPSTFLPATMIIGLIGAVLLIQRTRGN